MSDAKTDRRFAPLSIRTPNLNPVNEVFPEKETTNLTSYFRDSPHDISESGNVFDSNDHSHERLHAELEDRFPHDRPCDLTDQDLEDCQRYSRELTTKIVKLQQVDLDDRHVDNARSELNGIFLFAERKYGVDYARNLEKDERVVRMGESIMKGIETREYWMKEANRAWIIDGVDVYSDCLNRQKEIVQACSSVSTKNKARKGCTECLRRVWLQGFEKIKKAKILYDKVAFITHYSVQESYFLLLVLLRKMGETPYYLNVVEKRVGYCYDFLAARYPHTDLEIFSMEFVPDSFRHMRLNECNSADDDIEMDNEKFKGLEAGTTPVTEAVESVASNSALTRVSALDEATATSKGESYRVAAESTDTASSTIASSVSIEAPVLDNGLVIGPSLPALLPTEEQVTSLVFDANDKNEEVSTCSLAPAPQEMAAPQEVERKDARTFRSKVQRTLRKVFGCFSCCFGASGDES